MTRPIPPGSIIGILGSGQLGRMIALAARNLGYRIVIFSPEAGAPAAAVADEEFVADYLDLDRIREFAKKVDVVTFEFENVSAAGLDLLASLRPVRPSPAVLRISQDRAAEKSFVNAAGIATAPWRLVETLDELHQAAAALGLPAILKTTRLGYDGRGQRRLNPSDDLAEAFAALAPQSLSTGPLILEGFIDFACEVSVIVARGVNGDIATFDVAENRHRHHILDLTLAPARIPEATAAQARDIAHIIAQSIDLVGLLVVEMFIDARGAVVVNEIAPRPHNSGHWTIDACPASQFEMHIRAVAGLPLPPATRHSDAVMKNLVGPQETALWPEILATPGLIPHLYGKSDARPGRKMGHVTRLFPRGGLPGDFAISDALGPLAPEA